MRTRTTALLVALVASGCGLSFNVSWRSSQHSEKPEAHGAPAPKAPSPTIYDVRPAAGPITIDGTFDGPAWRRAAKMTAFCSFARKTKAGGWPDAESPTVVRMLWDANNLYLAIEMADKDVCGTYRKHDAMLWQEDVIEIFVKPTKTNTVYYELQVNALGTTLDMLNPRRRSRSFDAMTRFESGMRAACVVDGTLNRWQDEDRGWRCEIAIPLSAFKDAAPAPKPGTQWRLNLSRYDYSVYRQKPELSSWSRLAKPDFHRHDEFNRVRFVR